MGMGKQKQNQLAEKRGILKATNVRQELNQCAKVKLKFSESAEEE